MIMNHCLNNSFLIEKESDFLENYLRITIAGTGNVGFQIAVLLIQHNTVKAVDIVFEKVELIYSKTLPKRAPI